MDNGIRTGDPRSFNKGRSSKFREGSRVRQTPEEGRKTYRVKLCRNNNKDEDNSPKTLNNKNNISHILNFNFWANTIRKNIEVPYPSSHRLNCVIADLQQGWFRN